MESQPLTLQQKRQKIRDEIAQRIAQSDELNFDEFEETKVFNQTVNMTQSQSIDNRDEVQPTDKQEDSQRSSVDRFLHQIPSEHQSENDDNNITDNESQQVVMSPVMEHKEELYQRKINFENEIIDIDPKNESESILPKDEQISNYKTNPEILSQPTSSIKKHQVLTKSAI